MAEEVSGTVQFKKWVLATPADMATCLIELTDLGPYRGRVAASRRDTTDAVTWELEVGTPDMTIPITAYIGYVVVLLLGQLRALTTEEYTNSGLGE